MAIVRYTWFGDSVIRLLGIFIFFAVFVGLIALLGEIRPLLGLDAPLSEAGWIPKVLYLALIVGCLLLTNLIREKTFGKWLDCLSAYLYISIVLRTRVTLREASYLAYLFVPNEEGVWYPLKEVRGLDGEDRRDYLMRSADSVYSRESVSSLSGNV